MSSSDDKIKSSSDDSLELNNKPKSKNTAKKFYENHPEKKELRIVCQECGMTYKYSNKTKHYGTQKHKDVAALLALEREKMKNEIKAENAALFTVKNKRVF